MGNYSTQIKDPENQLTSAQQQQNAQQAQTEIWGLGQNIPQEQRRDPNETLQRNLTSIKVPITMQKSSVKIVKVTDAIFDNQQMMKYNSHLKQEFIITSAKFNNCLLTLNFEFECQATVQISIHFDRSIHQSTDNDAEYPYYAENEKFQTFKQTKGKHRFEDGMVVMEATKQAENKSLFKQDPQSALESEKRVPICIELESEISDEYPLPFRFLYQQALDEHRYLEAPMMTPILKKTKTQMANKPFALHELQGLKNTEDGQNDCVICMSNPNTFIVMPCRHRCLCGECASSMKARNERCPMCRGPIEGFVEFVVNK